MHRLQFLNRAFPCRENSIAITKLQEKQAADATAATKGKIADILEARGDLDAAIDDLIDALRDYASDWNDRLHVASNHQDNWAVAALVELSTHEQLRSWLLTIDTIAER